MMARLIAALTIHFRNVIWIRFVPFWFIY